jgi:hypothetical protein
VTTGPPSRAGPGACTPGMGDRFRGGSPRGWEVMPDRADGNRGIVRCRGKEAGGETLDLTNRNRIGGTPAWVSQHGVVSPSLPRGAACRCGGGQGRAVVLIRGDLAGCRCKWDRLVPPTGMAVTLSLTCQESAEAVVPAGFTRGCVGWEGPNVKQRG